jgi:hypothetical protein
MDFRSAKEKISNYLPELKNMANQTNDQDQSFQLNNLYERACVLLEDNEIDQMEKMYDKDFIIKGMCNKLSVE